MSLADKFEYLIGTKTAIRDALNESGARIDESLPFRQYAGWIDWLNYSRANELRSLFLNDETGTLASDLPYFVDVDGNTPATWGDPVGLIRDASPNRADFTQPTVTARPILGRVPRGGRRNKLGFTEDVSRWGGSSGEVSLIGGIDDPDGGATAIRLTGVSGLLRATVPVQVPYGQNGTLHTTRIWLRAPSSPSSIRIYFANVLTEAITPTAEWAEYVVTVARWGASNPTVFQLRIGGEGEVVDVWHPQSELGSSPTPYQKVTSEYDITESGVPEIHYLDIDLTDDNLTTTLPAIENGTVVIAGTNGIWIDDDYNFAGGTFSIGPTSYPNGPDGILTAIGDPIERGLLVINRQLTQLERERIIQEMKERGAPGVFEMGPELVVNGDFSEGLEGITFNETAGTGSATISESGGVVTIQSDLRASNTIAQLDPTPAGFYMIETVVTAMEGGGHSRTRLNDQSLDLPAYYVGGEGTYRYVTQTGIAPTSVLFQRNVSTVPAPCIISLASISVRKLELIP